MFKYEHMDTNVIFILTWTHIHDFPSVACFPQSSMESFTSVNAICCSEKQMHVTPGWLSDSSSCPSNGSWWILGKDRHSQRSGAHPVLLLSLYSAPVSHVTAIISTFLCLVSWLSLSWFFHIFTCFCFHIVSTRVNRDRHNREKEAHRCKPSSPKWMCLRVLTMLFRSASEDLIALSSKISLTQTRLS